MALERVQVLLRPDQRRRLEEESRARGTSVTALVREAIDRQYGDYPYTYSREERMRAFDEITQMRAQLPPPKELQRLIDETRDPVIPESR
jgi:hypothetical protein